VTGPRIIAEAGVNHNGSLERALLMVDAATDAGADAVKFQSFDPSALVAARAEKADYQARQTGPGTQLEMLESLRLDRRAHEILMKRCGERGIGFLSSVFDVGSVEMLAQLGVREFKVPSGEITDLPVLRAVAAHARSVLLSTGMSTVEEIAGALDALEQSGLSRGQVVLLHCTTEYPAPPDEVNLRAMAELETVFGLPVGYSDHTRGIEISVAAAALGAVVIEKHFTLDRELPGPDHAASIAPDELASLVAATRNVGRAMGEAHKQPTPSEQRNAAAVRKSIVASRRIEAGEVLTEANVTTKRPGLGLSPMSWDSVLGTPALHRFEPDEVIEL
jgi:N,N'-diacetyllegionaminate synthase